MTKKMLFLLALLCSPARSSRKPAVPPRRRATGGFLSAPALVWPSLPAFALWVKARRSPALAKAWRAIRVWLPAIRAAMILGLVFIESLALYTLVIIFIKVV